MLSQQIVEDALAAALSTGGISPKFLLKIYSKVPLNFEMENQRAFFQGEILALAYVYLRVFKIPIPIQRIRLEKE
ncbi:hypothetical protein SAMN05421578_10647 [Paenibacillus macquariensis]|uniref:Uncharacterized protein n=1 Tax=Paenibacillus macquariensis TaxID=948756 RepID=A0ABY1JZ75_9BACL|nr:hypothetical protein SAMN05421578_10647 [Paenibacillus macquariensis]